MRRVISEPLPPGQHVAYQCRLGDDGQVLDEVWVIDPAAPLPEIIDACNEIIDRMPTGTPPPLRRLSVA